MTRAIIYCRMSKNDKESDSLERQEVTCRKYAAEKGYEVIAVLKDMFCDKRLAIAGLFYCKVN